MNAKAMICLAALLAAPFTAHAEDISDRAAELAGLDARLTTGTRFEKIAALESVISSADLTRVQIAIKLALASDDAELRAVALRGYFAFNNRFVVVRTAPEAAREDIENLVAQMKFENDPGGKVAPFAERFRTVTIELRNYEFATGKGVSNSAGQDTGYLPFVINAENLTFRVSGRIDGRRDNPISDCFYDLRLVDKSTLRGRVDCGSATPPGSTAEIRLY